MVPDGTLVGLPKIPNVGENMSTANLLEMSSHMFMGILRSWESLGISYADAGRSGLKLLAPLHDFDNVYNLVPRDGWSNEDSSLDQDHRS